MDVPSERSPFLATPPTRPRGEVGSSSRRADGPQCRWRGEQVDERDDADLPLMRCGRQGSSNDSFPFIIITPSGLSLGNIISARNMKSPPTLPRRPHRLGIGIMGAARRHRSADRLWRINPW